MMGNEFWERFLANGVRLGKELRAQDAATKRDEAIDAVGSAAPPAWMASAIEAVRRVAVERMEFTTDELWPLIGSPPEPRAMGAVMKIAKDKGWIEPTFLTRPSSRRECNCRPIRVWKSRIWSGKL